jgi:hypothetical protein
MIERDVRGASTMTNPLALALASILAGWAIAIIIIGFGSF